MFSKKIITLGIVLSLVLAPASAFAAVSSGGRASVSAPSTSARSGSFSAPSSAPRASTPAPSAPKATAPSGSTSGTFSGSTSTKSNVGTAPSPTNTKPSTSVPTTSTNGGINSGYSKPTVSVQSGTRTNPYTGSNYRAGSTYYNSYDLPPSAHVSTFGSHIAMFAAGTALGTMMHPWGGTYAAYGGAGYVAQPFSFWYLIIDLFVLFLILGFIIWIFRRATR